MPVTTRSSKGGSASSPSAPKISKSKDKTPWKKRKATSEEKTDNSPAKKSKKKEIKQPNEKMGAGEEPKLKKIKSDPTSSLLSKLPRSTAREIGLEEPLSSDAKTLFALFLAADLSSARIGHDIAFKSTRKLIEQGWNDVKKLQASSWKERTEVLTEGGYTRYREKTATYLGEIADMMMEKYDGDLNNLFKEADGDIKKARSLLKEFKSMGDTGVDIFLRDAQMFYDYLVPFADKKALEAADRAGIGKTAEEMYETVGKDARKLSALCTSLVINGF